MTRSLEIKISRRRGLAEVLVDDDDYPWISGHRWCWWGGYVARNHRLDDGRQRMWPMHREIMGLAIGDPRVIHHINENKLDNRKKNLLVCADMIEAANQPHPKRDLRSSLPNWTMVDERRVNQREIELARLIDRIAEVAA